MKLLNVGCGSVFHPTWVNLDLVSNSVDVQAFDIRQGFPFPNSTFDACYSSHLLEHFTLEEARSFIEECFRVLKPGGILRVVVPDLEGITKSYLLALNQVKSGLVEAVPNYDWMMLELCDQLVRTASGGQMYTYLLNSKIEDRIFIRERIGSEADYFWQQNTNSTEPNIWLKLKSQSRTRLLKKLREKVAGFLVAIVAGRETQLAFEEGVFRHTGEVHRWMYDCFSLQRLLKNSKFNPVCLQSPYESQISNFNTYELDVVNNQVRKPDSIFVEGTKP
jgi:predicted SAM-dependent methyltransferase